MKLFKVSELLSEAFSLVFLFKIVYCNELEDLADEETKRNFNDIDSFNGLNVKLADDIFNDNERTTHSRSKRFIAFPAGSSFSTAVCMTTGVIGNPVTEYLSMGLNWGLAYNLPNSTWVLQHASGFGSKEKEETVSPQIKRRHRRDLYGKLETLINGT